MSDGFMRTPDEALIEAYGNIVDEIKSRLEFVDWALDVETPEHGLHIAISDFCCLQFRKIFEAIALGCLVAHSEHPEASGRLRKMYRADQLLDALEKLDKHFYPTPCEVNVEHSGNVIVRLAVSGTWLTKANLKKLYFAMDDVMHVGALIRRKERAEPFTHDSLAFIRDLIRWLLSAHVITLFGGERRLVVEMYPAGPRNVLITVQTKRS